MREAVTTRAHTEEMLAEAGADIDGASPGARGGSCTLRASALTPVDCTVPGDPSQAAFWVVAGCVVPRQRRRGGRRLRRTGPAGLRRRAPPHGGRRAPRGRAGPGVTAIRAVAGPLRATTVAARRDPLARRGPRPGRGRGRGRRAPPCSTTWVSCGSKRSTGWRRWPSWSRPSGPPPRSRATTCSSPASAARPLRHGAPRQPRRPPHGHGRRRGRTRRRRGGRSDGHGVRRRGDQLPAASLDDLDRLTGRGRRRRGTPGAGRRHRRPGRLGKSTVSRAVAERLGLDRLDTGAMYRAVAALALERGIDPDDRDAVAALAEASQLEVGERVSIDGPDVTGRHPLTRGGPCRVGGGGQPRGAPALVARQRDWAEEHGGGVVEGRDIGVVVFPRRRAQGVPDRRARGAGPAAPRRGRPRAWPAVTAIDSTRAASPLRQAPDARTLDTTGRTVEEVVEEVLSWL